MGGQWGLGTLVLAAILAASPSPGWTKGAKPDHGAVQSDDAADAAEAIGRDNAAVVSLYRQGRYAEALDKARAVLDQAERTLGPEHPDTLVSVNNLAGLYRAQGRYGEAEPLYRRALEASERVLGPEHPSTLVSVNNLAFLYESQGRYGEAEPLYRRALEAHERVLGPEHPSTLVSVNNLAGLYRAQGRYGEAEPLYRRALEASERVLGPEHPSTLVSVNNLAGLYESQGRYGEAEPLYRRALEARERVLGPEHPSTLVSVNNLAGLYRAQGRYGEAEPLYRRALEASERVLGPEHPNTIASRGNLSVLMVRLGRFDEALRFFRANDQALAQWTRTEVHTAQAAMTRRLVLQGMGRYQDVGLTVALIHPSPDTATFAADLVLRWKKRLAQDDAVLNNLTRESQDPALLGAIDRVRAGRRALSNAAFDPNVPAADKTRLSEALDAAEATLRAASERFRRFLAVREADTGDVQIALPRGSALVEYKLFRPYDFDNGQFTGAVHLLAVILRPEGAPWPVDLGDARPILDIQRRILANHKDVEVEALLREGHQALIAPLLPHLRNVDTLFLAPDGPLHALPFAALTDESGQRLAQRVQALRLLQTGRDLVARERPATGTGLVAVGGVDFGPMPTEQAAARPADDTGGPVPPPTSEDTIELALRATRDQMRDGFKPLPGSLREARAIAETYADLRRDEPAPVVLTGPEATEEALKSLTVPPRALHLATHGYYLETGSIEGRPLLQSGIALAGANRVLSGDAAPDGENGILHALEVQTLNLYGTELVVLSACETGQGVFDYSEGLEGLPRALYVAGAKNVLAALWTIDDRLTATFMSRFYETWLSHPGMSPAEALQRTQLRYITSPSSAERHPATWAPFVLYEG